MKTFFKMALGFFAAFVLVANVSYAQIDFNDPKFAAYGADAASREANYTNYSFFRDDYNLGNYDSAVKRLNELTAAVPAANENVYILGITMYKKMLASPKATDEQKQQYMDAMFTLYDLRDANFGDNPAANRGSKVILANKAIDMIRYRPEDLPAIRKAVAQAIAKSGQQINLDMLVAYFNLASTEYISDDTVEAEDLLNDFDMVTTAISGSSDAEGAMNAQRSVDELLLQSGAASCENLETLFRPQFEADPDNADLVKKIVGYLSRNECKSEFTTTISEKYYHMSPSADAAFALGMAFAAQGDDAKAVHYFKEAVDGQANATSLPRYLIRFAGHELMMGRPMTAANYARRAIQLDKDNPLGYRLLAQAYALGTSKSDCDDFSKKAVFWLMVDNLNKAKSLTTEASEITKINTEIRNYTPHFPTTEDIFFQNLKVGDSCTVTCGWMTGTTTVRTSN